MCIALHKPAGVKLTRRTYENCFDANIDGAGFAYAENGKIVIEKGFFDFDSFYLALTSHEEKNLLIHFRISTAGKIDQANCHPWIIERSPEPGAFEYDFAIIHNGVLSYPHSADKSDTGHFVDEILAPHFRRDPYFAFTNAGRWFLEKSIGSWNKLVILRSDGLVSIINEQAGKQDLGAWFSNDSYKDPAPMVGYGSQIFKGKYPSYMGEAFHNKERSAGRSLRDHELVGWPEDDPVEDELDRQFEDLVNDGGLSTYNAGIDRIPLNHLTKRERKTLRKQARRCVESFFIDPKSMTDGELIEQLRNEYLEFHPQMEMVSTEELDRQIVKSEFYRTISAIRVQELTVVT